MQKNNFKQDHKSPASNQTLKNKEIKGAGAETYPTGKAVKGGVDIKQPEQQIGGRQDLAQGAQDAQMKTGRSSDFESADFAEQNFAGRDDQDDVDQDDSTKAFAADSKSRGSKLDDVQSQPSKHGSQNSRH